MAAIVERSGRYYVVYWQKDAEGKRKQKWESYPTIRTAQQREAELNYRKGSGRLTVPSCRKFEELLEEYVEVHGKNRWALSTYSRNRMLIDTYIIPFLGKMDVSEISVHVLDRYYRQLAQTPVAPKLYAGHNRPEFVPPSTIRDIYKVIRSALDKAARWGLVSGNPAALAEKPRYKQTPREVWPAATLIQAMQECDDDFLSMAMHLAFAATLRMGELLGLTWDCVDMSEESVRSGRASIFINKELQRVRKDAAEQLNYKDILYVFPGTRKRSKTIRVLKTPKNESSIRRVYIPTQVACMLRAWKERQDEQKRLLGDRYHDNDLVMCNEDGTPGGASRIRKELHHLAAEHGMPDITFHSLRHTSITYKLKITGGDIKAVQGDAGHAEMDMILDIYSHIVDEDRRKNALLLEEAFYGKKNPDPEMRKMSTLTDRGNI